MNQASGARLDRVSIVNDLTRGPAVAHFDRLARGVVQNRLWDVVPHREDHQRAVRAVLIPAMTHELWPGLHGERTTTGHYVADQIRQSLNAKVDAIRRHYRLGGRPPFGGDSLEAGRVPRPWRDDRSRADGMDGVRFLGGVAPAGGAVSRRPVLGQGGRGAGGGSVQVGRSDRPAQRTRE